MSDGLGSVAFQSMFSQMTNFYMQQAMTYRQFALEQYKEQQTTQRAVLSKELQSMLNEQNHQFELNKVQLERYYSLAEKQLSANVDIRGQDVRANTEMNIAIMNNQQKERQSIREQNTSLINTQQKGSNDLFSKLVTEQGTNPIAAQQLAQGMNPLAQMSPVAIARVVTAAQDGGLLPKLEADIRYKNAQSLESVERANKMHVETALKPMEQYIALTKANADIAQQLKWLNVQAEFLPESEHLQNVLKSNLSANLAMQHSTVMSSFGADSPIAQQFQQAAQQEVHSSPLLIRQFGNVLESVRESTNYLVPEVRSGVVKGGRDALDTWANNVGNPKTDTRAALVQQNTLRILGDPSNPVGQQIRALPENQGKSPEDIANAMLHNSTHWISNPLPVGSGTSTGSQAEDILRQAADQGDPLSQKAVGTLTDINKSAWGAAVSNSTDAVINDLTFGAGGKLAQRIAGPVGNALAQMPARGILGTGAKATGLMLRDIVAPLGGSIAEGSLLGQGMKGLEGFKAGYNGAGTGLIPGLGRPNPGGLFPGDKMNMIDGLGNPSRGIGNPGPYGPADFAAQNTEKGLSPVSGQVLNPSEVPTGIRNGLNPGDLGPQQWSGGPIPQPGQGNPIPMGPGLQTPYGGMGQGFNMVSPPQLALPRGPIPQPAGITPRAALPGGGLTVPPPGAPPVQVPPLPNIRQAGRVNGKLVPIPKPLGEVSGPPAMTPPVGQFKIPISPDAIPPWAPNAPQGPSAGLYRNAPPQLFSPAGYQAPPTQQMWGKSPMAKGLLSEYNNTYNHPASAVDAGIQLGANSQQLNMPHEVMKAVEGITDKGALQNIARIAQRDPQAAINLAENYKRPSGQGNAIVPTDVSKGELNGSLAVALEGFAKKMHNTPGWKPPTIEQLHQNGFFDTVLDDPYSPSGRAEIAIFDKYLTKMRNGGTLAEQSAAKTPSRTPPAPPGVFGVQK